MDNIVLKARDLAMKAHEGQTIKGSNIPYVVHCAQVAGIIQATIDSNIMIAAAWLHDAVEDTSLTLKDISEQTHEKVAEYVHKLTDQATEGNRTKRKLAERQRLGKECFAVQTIKLADIISNLTYAETLESSFRSIYIKEKRALITVLATQGYLPLWRRAERLGQDAMDHYEQER